MRLISILIIILIILLIKIFIIVNFRKKRIKLKIS
jgi:hypothetical protein